VSVIDETRFVERLQFFDGQRLFASDLQGIEAFNREMRWLHNQSLHQPGVGSGFALSGEKGDREVTAGPGYAIDSRGREIISTDTRVLPAPPVAGDNGNPIFFDLTVAYPDDAALEETETREGVCLPRGVIRLREAPVFCWVELGGENLIPKKQKLKADLQNGLKIRLGRIEVLNCQLNSKVSVSQRQNARPALAPYIASDVVKIQDLTNFDMAPPGPQFLVGLVGDKVQVIKIIGTVDTSQAGFLTTPEYTAHITGPRNFKKVAILDMFQITSSERDKFEFSDLAAVIPLIGESPPVDKIKNHIRAQWRIVWMGVER
jgi:hypothetical protein